MDRWIEHHFEISSKETAISDNTINVLEMLLTMEELDAEPTFEELSTAIEQERIQVQVEFRLIFLIIWCKRT